MAAALRPVEHAGLPSSRPSDGCERTVYATRKQVANSSTAAWRPTRPERSASSETNLEATSTAAALFAKGASLTMRGGPLDEGKAERDCSDQRNIAMAHSTTASPGTTTLASL